MTAEEVVRLLKRAAEKAETAPRDILQGAAVALANEMMTGGDHSPGTPIDDGFHRSHWDAAIGTVPAGVKAADPGAAAGRVLEAILEFEPGKILYITNNGPAIRRLEFGFTGTDALGRHYAGFGPRSVKGRSSQAPDGFIRPAAEAWSQIVAKVAANLERRGLGTAGLP